MAKNYKTTNSTLDELCINTIRFLSADGVEKANSGHPGMPMGDAAMAYTLWTKFLKHNPKNPTWDNRDRFVLSAGHGSMLLYSLLHLTGYNLSLKDLKDFRQWGSPTAGHPEYELKHGIETTTGPLGQGFATSVGIAISEKYLSKKYKKTIDHYTYGICGDGDLMEGVSNEAASLAGHLGLGKLIYLYSSNKITIEGSTDVAFTEDVAKRFKALNWHVEKVKDGNSVAEVSEAIKKAQKAKDQPSLIIVNTHIGFGSPSKQDSASAHGSPLGADDLKGAKEKLGWPTDKSFYIPDKALTHFRKATVKGVELQKKWDKKYSDFKKKNKDLAREFEGLGKKPNGYKKLLPKFTDEKVASRSVSGKVLNAIAPALPGLMGGSADLAPSNNTELKGFGDFQKIENGRNMHFGVREHAMGSILNGMALYGKFIPYGATFLVFSDYLRPSIRLSALMGLQVVYVLTHDSIGLGEDGPTHQPIEQTASLRAIPNLTVIRPADARETVSAWDSALKNTTGPTALILSRQGLDPIEASKSDGPSKGAYIVRDCGCNDPDIILISSGSEVGISIEAGERLASKGVKARVVSMPSFEIFENQSEEYKDSILPMTAKHSLAIEAGSPQGWHRYADNVICIEGFGASAPGPTLMEKYGFTADNIISVAEEMLKG